MSDATKKQTGKRTAVGDAGCSSKRLAYSIDSIIGSLTDRAAAEQQRHSKQHAVEPASHASSPAADNDKQDDDAAPVCTPVGHSLAMSTIECHLEGSDWQDFHPLGTEMIITKTGRRMFPVIKCSFSGLCERDQKYAVYIDIVPVDNKRYRYAYHKSSWLVAGKADPPSPNRLYLHPDSPFSSEQIVKQVISFEKMKLTNNELDRNGHIILNSMHKYQPRIHLVRLNGQQGSKIAVASTTELHPNDFKSYIFEETQFTAITAKKIERNPFAKGFRDSSRLGEYELVECFDAHGSYSRETSFAEIAQREMQRLAGPGGFMLMQALQMQQQQRRTPGIFSGWPPALVNAASSGAGGVRPPFNPAAFAANPLMAAQLLQLNAMAAGLAAGQSVPTEESQASTPAPEQHNKTPEPLAQPPASTQSEADALEGTESDDTPALELDSAAVT